jgi:hypothetical protein
MKFSSTWNCYLRLQIIYFVLCISSVHFLIVCPFFLQLVGSLVAHIGSGVSYEVSSALDIMISLTSNNSEELIPISSHITGKVLSYAGSWSLVHTFYSSTDI